MADATTKAANGIDALLEPIIKEAQSMEKPPLAYKIDPGNDWPMGMEKPPESMIYLPKIPDALLKLVPDDKMKEIRAEAESIVNDLGLPKDATVSDVQAGKYADRFPKEPQAQEKSDPETSSGPRKKPSGWRKALAVGAMATAGVAGMADSANFRTNNAPDRPPVRAMQAVGVERERNRHNPAQNRKGITVVELLVVIGIIGVLVGITLPAVQSARNAAREMQWKNNMRQVGLGIHNFEAAHKKFPYGMSTVKANDGTLVPHSWVVDILPHIGEQALYDKYDMRKPYDQQSEEVQNAKLATFSHPGYDLDPGRMHMAAFTSTGVPASDPNAIASQNGIAKDYLLTQRPGDFNVGMPPEWVMGENNRWKKISPTTMAGFTDGTSHTAIVGTHAHVAGNRDPWLDGKTRVTGLMFGTEVGQSRVHGGLLGNVTQPANFVTNHIISHDGERRPDRHAVLFADGSVRDVAATGPKGASFFNEGAKRWEEMVNRSDGKNPDDDLSR